MEWLTNSIHYVTLNWDLLLEALIATLTAIIGILVLFPTPSIQRPKEILEKIIEWLKNLKRKKE